MASPPSAGATLHPYLDSSGKGVAARSTVLRRTHPRCFLRASVARWRGVHQVLLTRGDCLRKELSSGKCRRHASFPFTRYAQGAWTRVASWPQASSRGLSWSAHGDRSGPHPWSRRRGARPLPRVRALARHRPVLPGVRAGARRAAGRLRAAARTAAALARRRRAGRLRGAAPARRRRVRDETPLRASRSEEHTSELQSLAYLVCRLLLEKKKKQ